MTILIIGAMENEVEALISSIGAKASDGDAFSVDKDGNKIVIAKSGVGKVNAAAVTQRLIDIYKPDRVINTGVAGGVADDIELGEIVIASKLAYHDFHPLEILERNPPFSMLFAADKILVSLAEQACEALGAKYRTGVVVSGDCFVNDNDVKSRLREEFTAECTEMEGAAIAHVCLINEVPFAVIRAVCDFANASAELINDFEQTAAHHAASITQYIINNIK